jgi:hypothetical protein
MIFSKLCYVVSHITTIMRTQDPTKCKKNNPYSFSVSHFEKAANFRKKERRKREKCVNISTSLCNTWSLQLLLEIHIMFSDFKRYHIY